jgi:arylsulfatase A-like enzyme/tetratricopeptide (TPR) repeat protein
MNADADQPVRRSKRPRNLWIALGGAVVAAGLTVAIVLWATAAARKRSGLIAVRPGCLTGWNVLLVSIDTLRADHLGCYGYGGASTPTLDKLAATGVRCRYAIAPAPMTLPSHASLLTGLDPHHHGARANGVFRLDEKVATLAERLRPRGYRTGAVISAYVLDRQYGLAQGFQEYNDDLTQGEQAGKFGFRERRADKTSQAAVEWLRRHRGDPFFLWVHYFDPHAPYAPPPPYAERFADRPYDGEIAFADDQLGRLLSVLDETGTAGRTLLIVVSDHGESLDEHREKTHGIMIYDATMRVPMIWRAPGVLPAGEAIEPQVGLIDVVPTVLDLLGEQVPAGLDGVSLLAPASRGPRELYLESLAPRFQYGWSPLLGLRTDGLKFVFAPRSELYDLKDDPNELHDIAAARAKTVRSCYERLRSRVGDDPGLAGLVPANLPMDAASRAKLESLGYVFREGIPPATQRALPDPKDMMGEWMMIQVAETYAESGDHAKTVETLEPLLRERPNNLRAWEIMSESYQALGRLDEALTAYRKEVELGHRKVEAYVGVGTILLEMGKASEAEEAIRRALAEDPQSPRAVFGLACVRARQNRSDEALKLFRQSIELGRGSNASMVLFNIGSVHHAAGQIDQARQAFEESLTADPKNARAARALTELMRQQGQRQQAIALLERTNDLVRDAELMVALGQMLAEDGQLERAAGFLSKSVDIRPDLWVGHFELAMALKRLGQQDRAIQHLRRCIEINPSLSQAHLHLGILLAGQNHLAEAERHIRHSIELAPQLADGYYNLGVLLAIQEKAQPASEAFQRAVELQPENAAARNALGQALMSLGRPAQAAEQFRQALRIDPKFTIARENLERCTTRPAGSHPTAASSRPAG